MRWYIGRCILVQRHCLFDLSYASVLRCPFCIVGEVLGFENLVYSVFEFIHGLIDTAKFKSTVKKTLDQLLYYVLHYMQITEEQVEREFNYLIFWNFTISFKSDMDIFHIVCYFTGENVDGKSRSVRGG